MGSPVGLTSARARDLLAEHGPNTIARRSARGRLATLLGPVADPMVLLLLVGAAIFEIGLEFDESGGYYLDFLTWEDDPDVTLDQPAGSVPAAVKKTA